MAVRCGHASLTYGELNERANRLAHCLAGLGVGPETRVAVCLERGLEVPVALLGVLKAGGAYVPLDPAYPADRLAFMRSDAGAAVVLTQERLRARFDGAEGARVLSLDAGWEAIAAAGRSENPALRADPGNLAYVIYTSGSTGRPKGVAVEHRQACRYLEWAVRAYPASSAVVHSSLAFDLTVTSLFAPLLTGGWVELVEEEAPVEALARRLERGGRYGLLKLTPTHLRVLGERLEGKAVAGGAECLVVGGEQLLGEHLEGWKRHLPGTMVVNEYGPTETVVGCCIHALPLADAASGPVPIGRAAAGTELRLLDPALRLVAPGEPGEVYVGGAQVTRGYLGRPALTAERFVPDPFADAPGARLYRTGDQARLRADGALEYLGRLDAQVKVRGFRVEVGEVEAALRRAPGVADCVVVARDDGTGEKWLVAYLEGAAEPDALRAWLARSLPEHMVPGAFVVLDRLPLTPNGKLDRKALPAPDFTPAEGRYTAPGTPVEEALAAIWREVLGVERVGVDQPFLALGGHSLRAIRVLTRVADAFGVTVEPDVLLRSGTIAEVAAIVEAGGGAAPQGPPLVPVPRGGPLPVSYSQEATWFFEQFAPGLMAYRAQSTVRMRGPLDVPVLERALEEIVRRHEIFRTTTPVEGGRPVQRVHAPWRVRLPVHDVSGLPEAEREGAAREIARREFMRPLDISVLPLVGWSLVRVAEEDHVFVVVEHHFVHDGWSFAIFLRELRTLYLAYRAGRPSPLPEPRVQFADFAAWQRAWVPSEAGEAKLRFWEKELAGAVPLVLPTDFPRPQAIRFRGSSERLALDPALADEARAFSRARGVTLFVTLMAAFQALLARYAGQEEFCVGSALGNRGHLALEDVIGMVVNSVAIRADLSGAPDGAELLRRVREASLRAYAHQEVPFDEVVRRLHPERTPGVLPVIQASFSFHDSAMPPMEWEGLTLEMEEAQSNGSAKFDLQVIVIPRAEMGMMERAGEVVMIWEYSTDLFARDTILRMSGHFHALLAGLLRHPGRPVADLPLLGEGERRQVVEGWSPPVAEAPAALVHELVAETAARAPGAVAVTFEDDRVTYGELEARANRLARHLARLGAGPEARVGVCLERSADLVVALVAVLKAGAAYLPLDPGYPAARLAYMLEDAGASLLVTQESLRRLVPEGARAVSLDGDAAAIAAEPGTPPPSAARPENAAYLIYTSGSTGRPKGVVVTHASASSFFGAMDPHLLEEGGAPGTWLAVTRVGFDIHVLELLWTLARGFHVVVAPDLARAAEEGALARRVRRHAVTHLQCTPSLMALALAESGVEGLAGLRRVLLGGEALPPDLAARIHAALPGALLNVYGPTEATVWSTAHPVDGAAGAVPIGRPLSNTRAYVLDAALHPQPVGVPGELCLGGAGVARGYLDRPGPTAERFVPDPFSPRPGARMYRTGDRARWGAAGTLDFLGRLDQQVKIRGFRVEPGEVEAALRVHPEVRACAVTVRGDAAGEPRLVGYVVGGAEPEALREHLRRSLPEHMVPSAFVALEALPLTPGGKLDRRALPAPEPVVARTAYVEPRTPGEAALAAIWGEVLGRDRVGVHDNFFDLGGHSLLAARAVARVRETLDGGVAVVSLFEHPTVARFAGFLAARTPAAVPAGAALEAADSPYRVLAAMDTLSDDELDRLLGAQP